MDEKFNIKFILIFQTCFVIYYAKKINESAPANISSLSVNLYECYEEICTEKPDLIQARNCGQNDCVCFASSYSKSFIRCKFSYLANIELMYRGYSEFETTLTIFDNQWQNFTSREQKVSIPKIMEYMITQNVKKLIVKSHYPDVTDRCEMRKSENSTLNFSDFPVSHIQEISFVGNCYKHISGNLSSRFPLLKLLKIKENFFSDIPERIFHNLHILKTLDISHNFLSKILSMQFTKLKALNKLHMHSNYIVNLPEKVFQDLSNLEALKLQHNKLSSLPSRIFVNNTRLISLNVEYNQLANLPVSIFGNLMQLQELYLGDNQLQYLNESIFFGLAKLKHLSLKHNKLKHIPEHLFTQNQRLEKVQLDDNPLQEMPFLAFQSDWNKKKSSFTFSNTTMTMLKLPLVKMLSADEIDISNNCFREIDSDYAWITNGNQLYTIVCDNCCLDHIPYLMTQFGVKKISLKRNYIASIKMTDFDYLFMLEEIHLDDNEIQSIEIEWRYPMIQDEIMTNPKTKIVLGSNPLICDCHLFNFLVMQRKNVNIQKKQQFSAIKFDITESECANLEKPVEHLLYTELLCNLTDECPAKCWCYYQPSDNVTIVNCSHAGLTEFPELNRFQGSLVFHLEHNQIEALPNNSDLWSQVKIIYISHNHIKMLKNIPRTLNMKEIYLDNNLISTLDEIVQNVLATRSDVKIAVSGNPLKCTCKMWQNNDWLQHHVIDYMNVSCHLENATFFLRNITKDQLCPNPSKNNQIAMEVILAVVVVSMIFTGICIMIIYYYKYNIRLWLNYYGLCMRFVTEDDLDADKKYDAFISYSSKDDEWVAEVLVPELEHGTPSYKLCLHERDWTPGEWISKQIIQSVEQSRRTIVVLTENFVKSEWSRLEFLAAYQQMAKDKVNRVIVIVPIKMPKLNNLNTDLQNFITTTTYLKYGQPSFWRKLKHAMHQPGHPSTTNQMPFQQGVPDLLKNSC